VHSQYQKEHHTNVLTDYERRIRQQHIPRSSLLPVAYSPWRRLFSSSSDSGMITLTRFDTESFKWLLGLFAPFFDEYSPFIDDDGYIVRKQTNRGRPRTIRAEDCLGLVLAWTRTRGSVMVSQLIFGMTMTPALKYCQFARRILVKVLQRNQFAMITMPSPGKLEEYHSMIHSHHPALPNVWSTMDGLKLTIEQSSDPLVQSIFYNGWKCDHFVTSVLVFAPDGTIPAAFYNVPGCVHDSQVAEWGNIYTKLEKSTTRPDSNVLSILPSGAHGPIS
jgi:hypothetical protein